MGRSFENRKNAIFKTAGQKSKLYSKYGKQIYVAAKNGVPELEANPNLRLLVERAKREQVPSHVIEKAIEKARGAGGEDFVLARYEGFGPGGCSVIVDCLTDNMHRTVGEVRNCFSKTSCKMGAPGAVSHQFDHLAVLSFKGDNQDAALEALMAADVDVDDVESKAGQLTLFVPPADFSKAKQALLDAFPNIEFDVQEITFLPKSTVGIPAEEQPVFEKLINLLNDCDDVQEIYHNAELPG